MNDSIGKDIVDLITFDLYSKCISTLKRKLATNPILAKIKHQAGISELESSIQNVIEISLSNTKSKIIAIKKSNIKNFFKSEHNKAEIIRWATTMTSIEDFDLRKFEMLARDKSVPMEFF